MPAYSSAASPGSRSRPSVSSLGSISRAGFDNNVEVCVRYLAAWLDGRVPYAMARGDIAGAEKVYREGLARRKDSLPLAFRLALARSRLDCARIDGTDGQRDGKFRASPRRASDGQRPFMGFDDAEAHREPDAGADEGHRDDDLRAEPRPRRTRRRPPSRRPRRPDHSGTPRPRSPAPRGDRAVPRALAGARKARRERLRQSVSKKQGQHPDPIPVPCPQGPALPGPRRPAAAAPVVPGQQPQADPGLLRRHRRHGHRGGDALDLRSRARAGWRSCSSPRRTWPASSPMRRSLGTR